MQDTGSDLIKVIETTHKPRHGIKTDVSQIPRMRSSALFMASVPPQVRSLSGSNARASTDDAFDASIHHRGSQSLTPVG